MTVTDSILYLLRLRNRSGSNLKFTIRSSTVSRLDVHLPAGATWSHQRAAENGGDLSEYVVHEHRVVEVEVYGVLQILPRLLVAVRGYASSFIALRQWSSASPP